MLLIIEFMLFSLSPILLSRVFINFQDFRIKLMNFWLYCRAIRECKLCFWDLFMWPGISSRFLKCQRRPKKKKRKKVSSLHVGCKWLVDYILFESSTSLVVFDTLTWAMESLQQMPHLQFLSSFHELLPLTSGIIHLSLLQFMLIDFCRAGIMIPDYKIVIRIK